MLVKIHLHCNRLHRHLLGFRAFFSWPVCPARIHIVQYLMKLDAACLCGDIVNILPLAQSTVSQHLKVLKEAGLIAGEIDGPRTCYYLNREKLAQFRSLITQVL